MPACTFVLIFKKKFTVSHTPERKERDCLNCGTIVQGRYCQNCGQENIIPKETFWSLVIHFFYDITHFDSKFFDTLKYLLFRPGFLSKEYLRGRRNSYLNPVRMYVFTSALFFLIFFAFKDPTESFQLSSDKALTKTERDSQIVNVQRQLEAKPQSKELLQKMEILKDTSRPVKESDLLKFNDDFVFFNLTNNKERTIESYDSVQKILLKEKRDGWFKRTLTKKQIGINNKFKENPSGTGKEMSEVLLHKLPYLFFVSLPFFALILKLLYMRRKQFYYADHAIFSIHHYIFSFLLLLFIFTFDAFRNVTHWGVFNFLIGVLLIVWPVYLLLEMKRFYMQGWFKTLVKFFVLNLLGYFVIVILFLLFVFLSIFQL
jgi:hypothetical protein